MVAKKTEKVVTVESRSGNRMRVGEREAQQLVRQYAHKIVNDKPAAKADEKPAKSDEGAAK